MLVGSGMPMLRPRRSPSSLRSRPRTRRAAAPSVISRWMLASWGSGRRDRARTRTTTRSPALARGQRPASPSRRRRLPQQSSRPNQLNPRSMQRRCGSSGSTCVPWKTKCAPCERNQKRPSRPRRSCERPKRSSWTSGPAMRPRPSLVTGRCRTSDSSWRRSSSSTAGRVKSSGWPKKG